MDTGSIPGSERSPGVGSGNILQDTFLGNSMDRGIWRGYSPWGRKRVGQDLAAKQQQQFSLACYLYDIGKESEKKKKDVDSKQNRKETSVIDNI